MNLRDALKDFQNTKGSPSSRHIPVKHKDNAWNLSQEINLVWRKVGAKKGDRGDIQLCKARNAPGAFHDDHSPVHVGFGPVKTVQEIARWKAGRKRPLTIPDCVLMRDSSTGVAEGSSLWVMKPDSDTPS